jgi:LPXTG-site transpeptidase (sortase) family protein
VATGPRGRRRWLAISAVLGILGAVLVAVGFATRDSGGADIALPAGSAASAPSPPSAASALSSTPARPPARGVGRAAPGSSEAPLPSSEPTAVRVPAVGIDSELMVLGVGADGTMEVPRGADPAGWFTGAPTPGTLGPAVIAGHVTWNGEDGVFRRLGDVGVGERVEVDREDGVTAIFEVTSVKSYDKDRFPTQKVYGAVPDAQLRLITCGGAFDGDRYSHNVVVYAELVDVRKAR